MFMFELLYDGVVVLGHALLLGPRPAAGPTC